MSSSAHQLLLYEEPDAFADAVGAFVRAGVRDGDRVLAALPPHKLAWLREELGGDAGAVEFADAGAMYERQGPMFAAVTDYVRRHGGDRPVRIVAEQDLAARSTADVRAYLRYEAASNVVYERHGASVLCPYDAARLPTAILDDAVRTHPVVLAARGPEPNARFTQPRAYVREDVRAGPVPAGATRHRLESLEDVATIRARVAAAADAAGLTRPQREDLTLAVTELAVNAVVHGRPPYEAWHDVVDGAVTFGVRDAGDGPADPLAGYLPPEGDDLGGRGLWIAHRVCDLVEVATDAGGTHARLHLRRDAP